MVDVQLIPDLSVSQPGFEADLLVDMAVVTVRERGWSSPRVIDIGCGSGYVGIRLAQVGAVVEACDIDPRAVDLASRNARLNGLHVDAFVSDLCRDIPTDRQYDLALFNPPVEPGVHGRWRNVIKNLLRRFRPAANLLRRIGVDRAVASRAQRDIVLRLLGEASPILCPVGVLIVLQPRPPIVAAEIPPCYSVVRLDDGFIAVQRATTAI